MCLLRACRHKHVHAIRSCSRAVAKRLPVSVDSLQAPSASRWSHSAGDGLVVVSGMCIGVDTMVLGKIEAAVA